MAGTCGTDPDLVYCLWLRNDPGYDWCIFQGYGIPLVSCADDGHVYLCDFLLSVKTAQEWLGMDFEIQSVILCDRYFQMCSIWTAYEYAVCCCMQ